MATTWTIRHINQVAAVNVNADSIVMSDTNSDFGVKRNDTDAVVVIDGAGMLNVGTGLYEFTFTVPEEGLTYGYSIEADNSGTITFTTGTLTQNSQWVTDTVGDTYFSTRFGADDWWTSGADHSKSLTTGQRDIVDSDEWILPNTAVGDTVPEQIKVAVCEQALLRLQNEQGLDQRAGLQSMNVTWAGMVKERYEDVGGIMISSKAVDALRDYRKYKEGFVFSSEL